MASALVSTLLMGAFLVVVVALSERRPTPTVRLAALQRGGALSRLRGSPLAMLVALLALTLVVGSGVVLYTTLLGATASAAQVSGVVLGVAFAVGVGAFVVWGAYSSARFYGLHRAGAVAMSAVAGGLLFLLAVVLHLVVAQ